MVHRPLYAGTMKRAARGTLVSQAAAQQHKRRAGRVRYDTAPARLDGGQARACDEYNVWAFLCAGMGP
jgi:hypothetical protein